MSLKCSKARISGLVLKVASRCNLNCSYCYVYNQGDTTYQDQPRFMADETVDLLLQRAIDYCQRHKVSAFQFIFHGGEPLLAPVSFYTHFAQQVNQRMPAHTQVSYALQTNGVLLTEQWCQTLGALDIRIGISIDGPPDSHDTYRLDHQGRGSYMATASGLHLAQRHPALRYHPGVLAVIDPTTDPILILDHFITLNVRSLNLLLPDGTHHTLPPHLYPDDLKTPYADWFIRFFDRWFDLSLDTRPRIRFFQQIINLILGFGGVSDTVGRTDTVFLVIETDGAIEAQDSLKVCRPGITKEGMHLQTHTLDAALEAPLIAQCADSHSILPTACRRCPVRDVCGGGFVVHRYHPANGFDNPSVYCRDLLKLITHIQNRLFATLPVALLTEAGVRFLSFEEASDHLKSRKSETNYGLVE